MCGDGCIHAWVLQMDVFEVEERGFYARIVSKRGRGVAVLLYKALDSLKGFQFHLKSSNLVSHADQNYVFTFTLHVSIYNPFTYIYMMNNNELTN